MSTTIHSNWHPHLQNMPAVCRPPNTQTGILICRTCQPFVDHHTLKLAHHTLKLASSSTEHASCLSTTIHSNWHPHLHMPAVCRPPYTQTGILIYRTCQLFVDHHTLKLASSSTHASCLSTTIHSNQHPHLQNMPAVCRPPYTQTGILIHACQLYVDHHTLKPASSSTEHASCLSTTIHSNRHPHLQNTPAVCRPQNTQTGILIYRTCQLFVDHHTLKWHPHLHMPAVCRPPYTQSGILIYTRQLFVDHHTLKPASSSTHASCMSTTTIHSNWHPHLHMPAVCRPPYTQTGILIYTCQLFVDHQTLKLASSSTHASCLSHHSHKLASSSTHASCMSTTIHSNWHPHLHMPAVCRPPDTQTGILIYTCQLFVDHHTLKLASSSTEHASCLLTTIHSNWNPHLQNTPVVCRPPYTQTGILIYTCQLFVDHHTLKLASSSTEHASHSSTTIHSNWHPHLHMPGVCLPPYTQTGILIYRTRQLFVDHHTLKLASSFTEQASCLSTTIHSNWHPHLQNFTSSC